MSILSRLFGRPRDDEPPAREPERYKDYDIYPEPVRDGSSWRIAARIVKEVDGELKEHQLVRVDTLDEETAAVDASIGKARQLIDEQGDRLFD
ncbi:HlyU family transcriptional regulator [Histidinibacterium aquaticum]|uniref:Uncharacterized protein n=1 Tax=Histidinibacterium aquaticum TaxID=2613962 RepID=A0A5J5GPI8_9RHOB|nr:HlyU family transcriptional regulator [Histidinibacterium aquaticum]KAA9010211.1 hypothetical protein F3S47_02890 [Histidinibacterium aquaticum]